MRFLSAYESDMEARMLEKKPRAVALKTVIHMMKKHLYWQGTSGSS